MSGTKLQCNLIKNTTSRAQIVVFPKEWPSFVVDQYDPVKELGRGRFGVVFLAKSKGEVRCCSNSQCSYYYCGCSSCQRSRRSNSSNNNSGALDDTVEYVALKIVGTSRTSSQNPGYARRECEILKELRHPNIIRLLMYWEASSGDSGSNKSRSNKQHCVAVMGLKYTNGPTLESLLAYGGKLSLICARVISAQLIDAVAYLHSRACVHRDIKPDNLMIDMAGALWEEQDDIWDDEAIENHHRQPQVDGMDKKGNDEEDDEISLVPYFSLYRKRWHVVLIDFGLARALTPQDLQKAPPKLTPAERQNLLDISQSQRSGRSLNRSLSRQFNRQMSAVGSRQFAAPEIISGLRDLPMQPGGLSESIHPIDVTKTLSDHVSFYGLMADAYSIGNTIKFMLTGVPPNENVDDVIALESSPVALMVRCCIHIVRSSSTSPVSTTRRKMHYRRVTQIPPEPFRLLKGLIHCDPQQRTSVRTARLYPWIDGALDGYDKINTKTIHYLSFASTTT